MDVTQQAVITEEEGMSAREQLIKARLSMVALARCQLSTGNHPKRIIIEDMVPNV
jgi:hypothetical protein